jgi:4-hydroxy-2-oxoglutarate aldolase
MPAIVSAFDRRGGLDLGAHRHNVELLASREVAGFVVAGSTGEGPYLEPGERSLLAAATRQAAPGSFLMVGLAAESLRTARTMVDEAVDGGADAVLALTPTTLVRHRADLVEGYFVDLAGRSPVPVFLYSVPLVTAHELSMDSAIRLAAHRNVAGMKDSGGHPVRISAIANRAAKGFRVFCGASSAISLSVAGGAFGAITASTNYAPRLVLDVVERSRRSIGSAVDAQERLSALAAAVERHGVAGVKYAASKTGLITGPPRRPLRPVTAAQKREIDRALAEAGVR